MTLAFDVRPHPAPRSDAERAAILADPGFGTNFSDHMAIASWTESDGWHDSAVIPYGPFLLDPASAVLHYAQEVFEGLKAYRQADGSVALFRPDLNAGRFQRSAARLALPQLPVEDFLNSVEALIDVDRAWVPDHGGEHSLYLRPFMFASEAFLGVRPAKVVTYCCLASPAGAYFSSGVKPINIWITTTYSRATPGGTGAAKCGGNYAAGLVAQREAAEHHCDQVLFLDGGDRTYVEELGGMNVYLVTTDHELITPELTGSILEGVTRDSILTLAAELGLTPVERRLGITELLGWISAGTVTEMFACGTAAVITPIGSLNDDHGAHAIGSGDTGETTAALRAALLDLQYGRTEDTHDWLHPVA